jgi:two-component system response regulator HydG
MLKILLVDDEAGMCLIMKDFLKEAGYEMTTASSGKEAISLYPQVNPDLILLDLGLPDLNGREVLKDVKLRCPQIKVMIISAYADQRTQIELYNLGADFFLAKPFMPEELQETVKRVLSK